VNRQQVREDFQFTCILFVCYFCWWPLAPTFTSQRVKQSIRKNQEEHFKVVILQVVLVMRRVIQVAAVWEQRAYNWVHSPPLDVLQRVANPSFPQ